MVKVENKTKQKQKQPKKKKKKKKTSDIAKGLQGSKIASLRTQTLN
jgi:hypothetical protein